MADLKSIEKRKLERFFGMPSGYVLDFSNKTFEDFILDHTEKNIYQDEYNYGSGSKANRLRRFWELESSFLVGKLILALLEHWKEMKESSSDFLFNKQSITATEEKEYEECTKIARRLLENKPVENIDAIKANSDSKDFTLLAKSIQEAIEKNEPESGLDRLHTFTVWYVRGLCDAHHIQYDKDDSLNSIFGKYVKYLTSGKLIDSTMTERILKSSISILESFNDVRNNKSLAHPNPTLNYHESILIFNNVSNTIKFLSYIEKKNKQVQPKTENEWNDDNLPF